MVRVAKEIMSGKALNTLKTGVSQVPTTMTSTLLGSQRWSQEDKLEDTTSFTPLLLQIETEVKPTG